jgi:hypothetical protein
MYGLPPLGIVKEQNHEEKEIMDLDPYSHSQPKITKIK